jgi:hypothetical protein
MPWTDWPASIANGQVADANDVIAALDNIKGHVEGIEGEVHYSEGTLAARPAAALALAGERYYRATDQAGSPLYLDIGTAWVQVTGDTAVGGGPAPHKSGGSDRLWTSGDAGGTTDGNGRLTANINHGLGVTPSRIGITPTANLTSAYQFMVDTKNAATFTAEFIVGVAGWPVNFSWQAFL